ncbi:hypothetical protein E2I00_001093 [Balaenoptera physalus]|uniref:Protein phosphatase 1 regulatory subunit 14 n=1 Tax=Balaenoptera physalus TaxID=9770 RepID=A0A643BTD2_BALPH|nr:hypothetical protein E2I00_001093 [Balaenoptera physalus]
MQQDEHSMKGENLVAFHKQGCQIHSVQEADMPDEVNIDELLELESEEERRRKIQNFVQELLVKLRGLHKQPGLRQPSPSGDRSLSPLQDRARTARP